MQFRRFKNKYFVRIDRGEEIMSSLKKLCEQEKITLAEVKALGAVDDFNVGLFDVETKQYHTNHFQFPAEIVSLWGTVTTKDGKFYPHIHMSAGDKDGLHFSRPWPGGRTEDDNVKDGVLNEGAVWMKICGNTGP